MDKTNMSTETKTVFMIIASQIIPQSAGSLAAIGEIVSKSLVGVATDLENAELLVTEDYVDLLKTNRLSATKVPLAKLSNHNYAITGCNWDLIEIPTNEVVNFTLD